MIGKLHIYNTLTRKKEVFEPINPPFVGMYVCGPTVYGDVHLGHSRPAVIFDMVHRYLKHLGYRVRYVRNITDVGHLENDADAGEDKIAKKARLEQLEPMEVVHYYTERYHDNVKKLNTLSPSIEPSASGHIIEQIKMIEEILENGFAYIKNGSVYFDVVKYNESNDYGKLSGRKLEDLISNTRELEGQEEKKNSVDFALWKKAAPEHIMRWPSPWSEGFPGWHLECSVMSARYLGEQFDIHGGGMDLMFPHHECEIAQSRAANNTEPVKYWMHNNMITINGQKMGKSLGNYITLEELFTGNHQLLKQAYSPMTIRFFILQSHYRSTLDFSNEALQAAEKGLKRLMNAYENLQELEFAKPGHETVVEEDDLIQQWCDQCYDYINDDFNSAQVLAKLFDLSSRINSFKNNLIPLESISHATLEKLKGTFKVFIEDIFALQSEENAQSDKLDGVMDLLIHIRKDARSKKDFATSDKIRDELQKHGITIKDEKDGTTSWSLS